MNMNVFIFIIYFILMIGILIGYIWCLTMRLKRFQEEMDKLRDEFKAECQKLIDSLKEDL